MIFLLSGFLENPGWLGYKKILLENRHRYPSIICRSSAWFGKGTWDVLGTPTGHGLLQKPPGTLKPSALIEVLCISWYQFCKLLFIEDTDLSRCVPLIFHGDDGESHRRRSFMVTSFASALIHKSPWDCRYLLYCVDNARACSSTYDTLDSWLAWSFVELAEGRWLDHSPWGETMNHRTPKAGKQIADGWRGILFAYRGDEKALAKLFHVRTNWISHEVCFHCKASRLSNSDLLYTDFGKNAKHRSTCLDITEFVSVKCDSNPWVRVPGFDPSMVMYDWLHVLDLSLVPDAAASVSRLHIGCECSQLASLRR